MNAPMEPILMRWADCGHVQKGGWSLAWSQLIGVYHPSLSEDSVAYRMTGLSQDKSALSLAVADGVGGGARGDVASRVLTEHSIKPLFGLIGDADGLAQWMRMADTEVQRKLFEVSFSPGAATLAAAWLKPDGSGHLMRVGDARVCLFGAAGGDTFRSVHTLISATKDQTYAHLQELPPEGACMDDPARMIGTGFMGEPELTEVHVDPGQTLLLCSDGLHRGLTADQIGQILAKSKDLAEAARQLASEARLRGSNDDISVLLAHRVSGDKKTCREGFLARLQRRLKHLDMDKVKPDEYAK
jgi:serine/threonine protein phosphatase PrpC